MTSPAIPQAVQEFLSKRSMARPHADDRRRFLRRDISGQVISHLSTTLPAFARKEETRNVYLYNISRQGIGFLIDLQLFPEERIQIELPDGQLMDVFVKRCLRLASGWFQIGAMFARTKSTAMR